MPSTSQQRDFVGYGETSIHPRWPEQARIAVSFVVNYEEGAERNILDGDDASEHRLTDVPGATPRASSRAMNVESHFEYGSRAGFWRLHRLLHHRQIGVTLFAVAAALERNPAIVDAAVRSGWEIACHGLRWIPSYELDEGTEREHIRNAIDLHERLTGAPPAGWYTGAASPNTNRLASEHPSIICSSDGYADDLPYWDRTATRPLLIIPYAYDTNDARFTTGPGFATSHDFASYLIDAFDTLYDEGQRGTPKMMTIALHSRIAGRPGRTTAIRQFLDHLARHPHVWTPTRLELAAHWLLAIPAT